MNSKILYIFLILGIFEVFHFYYITADQETQQEITLSLSSKTKFLQQIFTSIEDYVLNTYYLIIEDDVIEIKKDQTKWKRDFNRFGLFIKVVTIRTYKTIFSLLKEILYPIHIIYRIIQSILLTTLRFIIITYNFLCIFSTHIILFFLKLIARIVRFGYNIIALVFNQLENIVLLMSKSS